MADLAPATSLSQPLEDATRRLQTQTERQVVAPTERPHLLTTTTVAPLVNGHSPTDVEANPSQHRRADVIPPPSPAETPRGALIPLQKWEGVVLEVRQDTFVARIFDEAGKHPDEEIELPKEELSPFESDLLEAGAIFYWTIGYRQRLPRGQRERVSLIRLRRLPAWSRAELSAAHARAEALAHDLGWK